MGILQRKVKQDAGIDKPLSFLWKKDRYVTFESENYLLAIQDQELPTKYLRYKGFLDNNYNNKYRLCMSGITDTGYILANCPQIKS